VFYRQPPALHWLTLQRYLIYVYTTPEYPWYSHLIYPKSPKMSSVFSYLLNIYSVASSVQDSIWKDKAIGHIDLQNRAKADMLESRDQYLGR